MNSIPIVMAFDENFAIGACVTMYSALRNKLPDTDYSFHIMTREKLLDSTYEKFNELKIQFPNTIINFIEVDDKLDNAYTSGYWTIEAYFRLIIADIFPNLDRCIYTDVDVVICDDLTELWNTDIGTNIIAGVRDISIGKDHIKSLGIPSSEQYIYSGFLLINLELIRREHLTQNFLKLISVGYKRHDMDILNVVCYNRIYFLPYKYSICTINIFNRDAFNKDATLPICPVDEIEDTLDNPIIIHYVTEKKPWNTHCDYALLNHLWYQMALESPYKINYLDNMLKGRNDPTKLTGLYDIHYNSRKSSTYRIGRAVTYIPRKIHKLIRRC
ncbi:MAG: glycosyltransferase family 8 protein [Oscillospiraceae bacterium]|nr:glycosyltransferase family 8 protein [Oscillospiraceae bacterium]